MKVKCSACGAVYSLDALVANQAASDALNAALLVNGELGKALIGYLGLFRPLKSSLTFERVATLLNELTPMIQTGKISRDGREYAAPAEAWIYAINQMLATRQTLKLPMKSHGYLLEIIASYKASSTAVVLQNNEQNRPIASSKMNAVKGALEWGMNG
ncbi:hypothetical protein [Pasteurella multocida]|uniref:hypothetical protein n=1 Tax=Pasteurella multocida TaxID=747 RepID=UPI00230092DC|nr:hypothetical protein [Pasteurella multocida]MDA5607038.1 hypothetical protein [Pasteurella multocida subsp. multocida]MDA5614699.1 hypothetical protein [Pasteurella multocida]MDA5624578.1 hypothetical protein [Pasteurella multocida]